MKTENTVGNYPLKIGHKRMKTTAKLATQPAILTSEENKKML